MRGAPVDVLQRVPLFTDLSKREVQQIARLFKERRFAAGETVVQEGSGGAAFFVIESGEAKVFIGGKEHTTLKVDDYFGEIALVDEGTRMATITATSELVCYGLTYWDFRPVVEANGVISWKLRGLFHRERNPFPRQIDFQNGDLYLLLHSYNFGRIAHESVGQLADVHQAVLVYADIDEGAESGDVGDDSGQLHSRFQILDLLHPFGEAERLEFAARIATRFRQLLENIAQGGHPDLLGHIPTEIDRPSAFGIGDQLLDRAFLIGGHRIDDAVAFGVNGAGIERIVGIGNTQESGRLLERLRSEPWDLSSAVRAAGTDRSRYGRSRCSRPTWVLIRRHG